jgi:tryptophan 2,3-dioxygenase
MSSTETPNATLGAPPAGHTPYSAWLQTETLHQLQQTVSGHPGEYGFLVVGQISELCWMLIVRELQAAQRFLRADDLLQAQRALQRVVAHHEPLNATWRSIAWMTPTDLLAMLGGVSARFGQDTALQGWTYRHMVYLLGIKQAEHLKHFEPQPHRLQQLSQALRDSSVYDDVVAYLARRGFALPRAVLERDASAPYVPHPAIEQAWRDVYADPGSNTDLQQLGETLADIAEAFSQWKFRHLMATRRTLGARPAYFGTEGIAWLLPTLNELPFPELWSARGFIGEPPPVCPHHKKQA